MLKLSKEKIPTLQKKLRSISASILEPNSVQKKESPFTEVIFLSLNS
jgi:hypothetical protein